MKKSIQLRRGFTLVEVVVVVTILVLLAGVLVPIVSNELSKARSARAGTDMKATSDAFTHFYSHTGQWPTTGAAFNASTTSSGPLTGYPCLFTNTFNYKGWAGPYLNTGVRAPGAAAWQIAIVSGATARGLVDPWGRAYQIFYYGRAGSMGAAGGIVLICVGENGVLDTSTTQMCDGEAGGDDTVQIVTRRL
ncbi:MAG: prepilin-type N-terminal cleavage/methylation domain-containing protein [Planctomycetes bacterium]|nr:prepilin-type N-terminal cleavage/methylation domain-containing protein [Planctomycetota bacterium]